MAAAAAGAAVVAAGVAVLAGSPRRYPDGGGSARPRRLVHPRRPFAAPAEPIVVPLVGPVPPLVAWALGCTSTMLTGWLVLGPAGVGVAALGGVAGPVVWRRHRRARFVAEVEADVPVVLGLVARSLRAGRSFRQALVDALEHRPDAVRRFWSPLLVGIDAGRPPGAELAELARRSGRPGLVASLTTLRVAVELGGEAVGAVESAAEVARDRARLADEVVTITTQARWSVGMLAVAPVVFAAVVAVLDPSVGRFLVGSRVGLVCLGAGLALQLVGLAWMRHLAAGVR